ncbi:MAG: YihY family inner membrane protein [Acidiferrobacteraceae bacterium]
METGDRLKGEETADFHTRLKRLARRVFRFILLVLRRFREDRCNLVAEGLSYTTLLAVVPLTAVAFAAFASFPVFKHWMEMLERFTYSHFLPATGVVVHKYLRQFTKKSAQLTTAGLIGLIATSMMLIATIESTFNVIWRTPKRHDPVGRFLIYWAILTLGPLLLGVSLSLTDYVISRPLFFLAPLQWLHAIITDVLPFLLASLAFVLLYLVAPNTRVRKVHAFVGAVFASGLFQLAKHVFTLFILHYSSYRYIYGALAVLPVFLIWIYLSWVIILLGALVTALLPSWNTLGD